MTDLTSAIALIEDDQGELVFGPEVPIQATNRPRTVRIHNGSELSWNRLEFKADKNDQEEVRRGSFLIVTEHPRSSFWWHHTPFRPVSKKSRVERERDDPARWPTDDRDEILQKLESLSYDPWETDGRYLTAGISRPAPGMNLNRTRRDRLSIVQLYGASREDPEALREKLYNGPRARRLLAVTKNRTIKFWPTDAPVLARKLLADTIAESEYLLHWSIQQALAGPHKNSASWAGRLVLELADRIYRAHLYNTNRRHWRHGVRT